MANDLEQRALKTLAQIKGHVAWRKGGIHRVPSIVEMSEWAEVVAELQQAQQPGAQAAARTYRLATGEARIDFTEDRFRDLPPGTNLYAASPPLPEGVSEEDVDAALKVKWPLHYNVMSAARLAYERGYMRKILESYRARLAAKAGGDRAG